MEWRTSYSRSDKNIVKSLLRLSIKSDEIMLIISNNHGMQYLSWLFQKVKEDYRYNHYNSYRDCFMKNLNSPYTCYSDWSKGYYEWWDY